MSYLSQKKLNKCGILTASFIVLIISGCIFAPSHKITTFDLGTPKSIAPPKIKLAITPFMNDTEAAFEMLYRTEKNQVEHDAYNRWVEAPGMLITSYLQNAFSSSENKDTFTGTDDYILSGKVTLFEINLPNKFVALRVNYRIMHNSIYLIEKDVTFKQAFDKASPDNFVKAMTKAAGDLASEIKSQVIKVSVKQKTDDSHDNVKQITKSTDH